MLYTKGYYWLESEPSDSSIKSRMLFAMTDSESDNERWDTFAAAVPKVFEIIERFGAQTYANVDVTVNMLTVIFFARDNEDFAKTSVDAMQAIVDELGIELRNPQHGNI